jgi:serine/threonine-protein kinase HipA
MNCLYCGAPLDHEEEEQEWHRRCSRAFFGSPRLPVVDVSRETLESLAALSVSEGKAVAGVQRKLSVHLSGENGVQRLTLVGHPTGYILKPQAEEYPHLPELEHVTMSLADRIDIMTVPHGLIRLGNGSLAYITRRIDRHNDGVHRIPMEDMCQLAERLTEDKYRGSYEQIARLVSRHSSRPGIDLTELFLTVVFSFVTGNADMHLKNVSLYQPDRDWVIAPAYDLLATALVLPDDDEEMALTVNGKKSRLRRSDFRALGETAGIHPTAVGRLIDRVVIGASDMVPAIDTAPLEPSTRKQLAGLLRERVARLRE